MRAAGVFVAVLFVGLPMASAKRSSGGDDPTAEAEIRARLRNDPDLKHDRIDIRVKDRVATLRGRVDSQSERAKADDLAHVRGVERVRNALRGGRSEGLQAVTDASISTKLTTQYAADQAFNRSHIAVTTTSGVVTVSGTVPSEAVHRRALAMVRSTSGVKGTKDKLQVAHTPAARSPSRHSAESPDH